MSTFRTVRLAPLMEEGAKRFFAVSVQDMFGQFVSLASERPTEEPGVIRWEIDYQCVPLFMCEQMGWTDLQAQKRAFEGRARALRIIEDLTAECENQP